jgi:hypothetical protein
VIDDPHDEVVLRTRFDIASSDGVSPAVPYGITTSERRRPGRIEEVSPALVPLLRGGGLENARPAEGRNDLDGARGLITGIATGSAVWILGVGLCYMIYVIISRWRPCRQLAKSGHNTLAARGIAGISDHTGINYRLYYDALLSTECWQRINPESINRSSSIAFALMPES